MLIRKRKKGKFIIKHRGFFSLLMGIFFLIAWGCFAGFREIWPGLVGGLFLLYYFKFAPSTTITFDFMNRIIIWERPLSIADWLTNMVLKKETVDKLRKGKEKLPLLNEVDERVLGIDKDDTIGRILSINREQWHLEELDEIILDSVTVGYGSRVHDVRVLHFILKNGRKKEMLRANFGVPTIYKWLKEELNKQIPGIVSFERADKKRRLKGLLILIIVVILAVVLSLIMLWYGWF